MNFLMQPLTKKTIRRLHRFNLRLSEKSAGSGPQHLVSAKMAVYFDGLRKKPLKI